MHTIKGIVSFPTVFTPKVAQGATEPKFSLALLLPPTDPQVAGLQAAVEAAKANGFPSGYTGQDECFGEYDVKYKGKDYYDPRFSGWFVLTCSAKQDDKPSVVDANHQPIVDPSKVYSGCVAWVNLGISGYTKGRGGVGGWLNGVMVTDEEPPMGRLDGKPSVEQMFANVGDAPASPASPAAPPPPPAAAPAAPAGLIMTAAANGVSYEEYKKSGWSDEQMIAAGVAQKPQFT